MTEHRRCYTCLELKPLSEFRTKTKEPQGKAYQCKQCSNKYSREYVRQHADERNRKRRIKYATDKIYREKEKTRMKHNYWKNKHTTNQKTPSVAFCGILWDSEQQKTPIFVQNCSP